MMIVNIVMLGDDRHIHAFWPLLPQYCLHIQSGTQTDNLEHLAHCMVYLVCSPREQGMLP